MRYEVDDDGKLYYAYMVHHYTTVYHAWMMDDNEYEIVMRPVGVIMTVPPTTEAHSTVLVLIRSG